MFAPASGFDGPLFRSVNRHSQVGGRLSDKHVAIAVKQAAAPVGLDVKACAGHSLRAPKPTGTPS
jgi:hypothetical protein